MTRVQFPVAEIVYLQNLVSDLQLCASFVRDAALVTESERSSQAEERARFEECLKVGQPQRKLQATRGKCKASKKANFLYDLCFLRIHSALESTACINLLCVTMLFRWNQSHVEKAAGGGTWHSPGHPGANVRLQKKQTFYMTYVSCGSILRWNPQLASICCALQCCFDGIRATLRTRREVAPGIAIAEQQPQKLADASFT